MVHHAAINSPRIGNFWLTCHCSILRLLLSYQNIIKPRNVFALLSAVSIFSEWNVKSDFGLFVNFTQHAHFICSLCKEINTKYKRFHKRWKVFAAGYQRFYRTTSFESVQTYQINENWNNCSLVKWIFILTKKLFN